MRLRIGAEDNSPCHWLAANEKTMVTADTDAVIK